MHEIHNAQLKQAYIQQYHLDTFIPTTVLQSTSLYAYEPQEFLCVENSELSAFFIMVKGKCKVTKLLGNGRQSLLNFCEGFTFFGEFELIEQSLATSSVEVLEVTHCLRISYEHRKELLHDLNFMNLLCRFFTSKLVRFNHNSAITSNCSVEEKLAGYIVAVCHQRMFRENHTQLAEYLGCSHRQLLRVLNQFCQRGWLCKEVQGYRIMDLHQLQAIAADIYKQDSDSFLLKHDEL